MIPNDPVAQLRLLTTFRPRMKRRTFTVLFVATLLGSIVMFSVNSDWTLIDFFLLAIYLTVICWAGERIVVAATRPRESQKIHQNRHLGDRLYIQSRCHQLLAGTNRFKASDQDKSYKVTVTRAQEVRGFSYHIDITMRELCGVDEESKTVFRFTSYGYVINPAVCAITHGHTVEVRTYEQSAGQGITEIATSIQRDYLEADDIKRIRYALDSDALIAQRRKKSTES